MWTSIIAFLKKFIVCPAAPVVVEPTPDPVIEPSVEEIPTPDPVLPRAEGPLLLVDIYWKDVGALPKWPTLAADPRFCGAIIKSTQGTSYPGESWFVKNWQRLRVGGGDRYGIDWFRGAYHYLVFNQDGGRQADYYLKVVEKAGGWDNGCILPVVDVEQGSPGGPNYDAKAAKVITTTEAFVDRVKKVTGQEVMLYGRGIMRDLGIKSKMGCSTVWNPSYTKTMRRMDEQGWPLKDITLWQYCGDGEANVKETLGGYELPSQAPGLGKVDISVYIGGGGLVGLRRRLLIK